MNYLIPHSTLWKDVQKLPLGEEEVSDARGAGTLSTCKSRCLNQQAHALRGTLTALPSKVRVKAMELSTSWHMKLAILHGISILSKIILMQMFSSSTPGIPSRHITGLTCSSMFSRYWVRESAVGKERLEGAWKSAVLLQAPSPSGIPNCRHKIEAKKGRPPHLNSFLITLLVFPCLWSQLAQSYRSVDLTRFISKRRLGWKEEFVLGQCSCFVMGVTLPRLQTCPHRFSPKYKHTVLTLPAQHQFRHQGRIFLNDSKATQIS